MLFIDFDLNRELHSYLAEIREGLGIPISALMSMLAGGYLLKKEEWATHDVPAVTRVYDFFHGRLRLRNEATQRARAMLSDCVADRMREVEKMTNLSLRDQLELLNKGCQIIDLCEGRGMELSYFLGSPAAREESFDARLSADMSWLLETKMNKRAKELVPQLVARDQRLPAILDSLREEDPKDYLKTIKNLERTMYSVVFSYKYKDLDELVQTISYYKQCGLPADELKDKVAKAFEEKEKRRSRALRRKIEGLRSA